MTALALAATAANAATPIATYEFGNNFNALEAGKPALAVTDPGGRSTFQTDTVLGAPRTVWAFTAASHAAADQAGVTLNTTGLVLPEPATLATFGAAVSTGLIRRRRGG